MNVDLVVAVLVAAAAGALSGWAAADWSCRRRWRRAATSGALPLRSRHAGPRRRGGHST
ncbi:hypothetical protein [Pseudonocardia sp. ICBG601]|uniref:hypothetical protein n=1 Tax=Pseudonocardia sp. ICBG601 TaxID=2846759 RepID=UPI001CF6D1B8|nr:hypothetical protein [Pseudonocardia sp. ICBG601]